MVKIVLVDTDDLLFKLNTSLFSREGFLLMSATTGREVLQITAANAPDMVFMNMDLPDMSGAACCLELKSNDLTRHIPVIVCVQPEREHDMRLLRLVGCDEVIARPIECKDFVAATRKFIQIFVRAKYRLPVRLVVQYGADSRKLLTGHSVNLSAGGMFIETDFLVPRDTVVGVEFLLPGYERAIDCTARVAWVNDETQTSPDLPYGMGVQFVGISREDSDLITAFVSEELQQLGLKVGTYSVVEWYDS